MATILELLTETMLASALRGQEKINVGAPNGEKPLVWGKWPDAPPQPEQDPIDTRKASIWHFTEPTIADGTVTIQNLTCLVRGMEYKSLTVCESVEWGPVSFCADAFHGDTSLPLAPEFVMKREFSREGVLSGTDRFWKLPLITDLSFEFVFAYQFPWNAFSNTWSSTPVPLKRSEFYLETLRTPFGNQNAKVSPHSPDCPGSATFRCSLPTIIVVITLVCCKEADYGLLNAARFFPMIMVSSNIELKTLTGAVRLTRPSKQPMHSMHHGKSMGQCKSMSDEKMTDDIGAILFTDRNEQDGLQPSVAWDQTFEYYDLEPADGGYVLAYPESDTTKQTRTLFGAIVRSYDVELVPQVTEDPSVRGNYYQKPTGVFKPRAVKKESRQGEYDNIHIAPRMILEEGQLKSNYGPSIAELAQTFKSIVMAPFCVHDCLHMHVRWSTWPGKDLLWYDPFDLPAFAPVNFRGWDGDSTPNAIPGAPMVPANQKITLHLEKHCGFQYVAHAESVKAGNWQFIMHHGASYSVADIWRGSLARIASPDSGVALRAASPRHNLNGSLEQRIKDGELISSAPGSYAMMYWNLRWIIGPDNRLHERLGGASGAFTSDELARLREVDLKSATSKVQAAPQHWSRGTGRQ